MIKMFFRYLFFILIGISAPVCFSQDTPASEVQTVQAGNFAPGQLEAHYLKHGYQLGYNDQKQYLQGARDLLDASPGSDVLQKIRLNGDVEHYRVSTGEFAVMTRNGRIRTYFKTDYFYWIRQ